MKFSLVIGLFLLATQSFAASKVVYGDDNRMDIFETPDQFFIDLAGSTAGMIPNNRVVDAGDGTYTLKSSTLGLSQRLCKDERYYNQPTAANCSGFLVAEDLLVTAGHCIKSQSSCDSNTWVFNYAISEAGDQINTIRKDDVYKCAEIIDRKLTNDKNDYALIRLDRPVVGRAPLAYRTEGMITQEANLLLVGHPSGLPTKIAPGAIVRDNTNPLFFTASTDSFGGNSGSAVFDENTGIVEGILVRGVTDYTYDSAARCYRVNRCEEQGCFGEGVTRITNIPALMK